MVSGNIGIGKVPDKGFRFKSGTPVKVDSIIVGFRSYIFQPQYCGGRVYHKFTDSETFEFIFYGNTKDFRRVAGAGGEDDDTGIFLLVSANKNADFRF